MILFYRILINIIFFLSPIIILIRLLKKKEDKKRFKEKFCFYNKPNNNQVIWFHGASVGELLSIMPLIEKFENSKDVKKILITSNTLSSAKILSQFNFKKTIHQFFPIDTNYHSKKFLDYWKPKVAIFIDSEIWPNMIFNLKKKSIPSILINGRITKKTFKKWFLVKNFSKKLFKEFNLCLVANNETKKFLKTLGAKKIRFLGNLKFTQLENEKILDINRLKKISKKRKIWCSVSTHYPEEVFLIKTHKLLKKKYPNLLTIIIPRHVERTNEIVEILKKEKVKFYLDSSKKKISKNLEIYVVDAYGKTKSFFNISKVSFIGGSIIKHGGQNPIEAAKQGCKIISGPFIWNFREIYQFLKNKRVAEIINSPNQLAKIVDNSFKENKKMNQIGKKIKSIGDDILKSTEKELATFIK